jgi:hypothetical protein
VPSEGAVLLANHFRPPTFLPAFLVFFATGFFTGPINSNRFGPYAEPVALLSQDFAPKNESGPPRRIRSHLLRYFIDVSEPTPDTRHVSVIAEFICGLTLRHDAALYWNGSLTRASTAGRLFDLSLPLLRNPDVLGWGSFLEHASREWLWISASHTSKDGLAEGVETPQIDSVADFRWLLSIWSRVLRLKWCVGLGPWSEMLIPTECEYHHISTILSGKQQQYVDSSPVPPKCLVRCTVLTRARKDTYYTSVVGSVPTTLLRISIFRPLTQRIPGFY